MMRIVIIIVIIIIRRILNTSTFKREACRCQNGAEMRKHQKLQKKPVQKYGVERGEGQGPFDLKPVGHLLIFPGQDLIAIMSGNVR